MTGPFSFYQQFNYCVSGKVATKSYPAGVYICGNVGGYCQLVKCQRIHENGIDSGLKSDKLGSIK